MSFRNQPIHSMQRKGYDWVLASIEDMIEDTLFYCDSLMQSLTAHHNTEAAAIFSAAQQTFCVEKKITEQFHPQVKRPKVAPWAPLHEDYALPVMDLMNAHYQMTPMQAWQLVEKLIQVHQDYYAYLKQTYASEEIQTIMALLENHCRQCRVQANQLVKASPEVLEDWDCPLEQS